MSAWGLKHTALVCAGGRRVEIPPEMTKCGGKLVVSFAAVLLFGCGEKKEDRDFYARRQWLAEKAFAHDTHLRAFLNGTRDMVFYDGWYGIEHDPATNSAWRWMSEKGIVRFRTRPEGRPLSDVEVKVHGWVPYEHVGARSTTLYFRVNGHELERFEPPRRPFEHTVFVPRWLLENTEWVDFTIIAANTARPREDWRDLGFATTGLLWTPIEPR
jgi:hypothetical protein